MKEVERVVADDRIAVALLATRNRSRHRDVSEDQSFGSKVPGLSDRNLIRFKAWSA
jgi:hypothetical protein